jgi:hypothetical protein
MEHQAENFSIFINQHAGFLVKVRPFFERTRFNHCARRPHFVTANDDG